MFWLGLTGSGGRRCVYIGGRNPPCPPFLTRSRHLFTFLITVYPVAWQADGSDYTVIINHGRKPWERRRDDRMGERGESEILWGLTGQHTCRSCPRISACAYFHHLDGSDLHHTRSNQRYYSPLDVDCFSCRDVKSLIIFQRNLSEHANVAYFDLESWGFF